MAKTALLVTATGFTANKGLRQVINVQGKCDVHTKLKQMTSQDGC